MRIAARVKMGRVAQTAQKDSTEGEDSAGGTEQRTW